MTRPAKPLRLRPWFVGAKMTSGAVSFVARVHRHLPRVQGGLWAVRVMCGARTVGVAIVGRPSRGDQSDEYETLTVSRVAVLEGYPNACSMLYGACWRAARAMGADNLTTYTREDEPGTSLVAAGWVCVGMRGGG